MPITELTLWKPEESGVAIANEKSPVAITSFAQQLSIREKKQITQSFEACHYEIAVNYVWNKSIAALKRELSTLGMKFLAEMVNKPNLNEDDDVTDALTDKEALRLAEELGIVSSTEAMRLRHIQEMIAHFSNLDATEVEAESIEMDELEAIQALKVCVKNILGKPKIEVAKKFVEFREALEVGILKKENHLVSMLLASPYFFRRLTINILMSVAKNASGAKLENALANINVLLPLMWDDLRETEKWQVGHTYRDVYTEGQTTAVGGLKQALLKVKGFDFVPETLRSDTFIKAAEAIIKAHEGTNNFYNEESPVRTLLRLGSMIPSPAFSMCASALISVYLGNYYGASFTAQPLAQKALDEFTEERWQYYLNHCLPGDIRVLQKLSDAKPRLNWCHLVKKYSLASISIKDKFVNKLVKACATNKDSEIAKAKAGLIEKYYGKV